MKIHARCCCGAEITIETNDMWEADKATMMEKEWREAHKDCKPIPPVAIPPLTPAPWWEPIEPPAGTIIKRDTKTTGGGQ